LSIERKEKIWQNLLPLCFMLCQHTVDGENRRQPPAGGIWSNASPWGLNEA
jgi:hypothetical protein